MRLTKKVRERLLELNEGFQTTTSNRQRNFSEDRTYRIQDRKLHIHEKGKTSWAHSRYDQNRVADDEETHRFLYRFLEFLKTDGID